MSKKIDKKEIILTIAMKKFARYGIRKTTIDEIAQEAHISKGLIYHYFSNKEDIFYAVLDREVQIIEKLIHEELEKTQTPRDKLKVFIETSIKRLTDNFNLKDLLNNIHQIGVPEVLNRIQEYVKREITLIKNILIEGMDKGDFKKIDPYRTAVAYFMFIRNILFQLKYVDDALDFDEMLELCSNIFLEGINT